jgi:hypothetical protein
MLGDFPVQVASVDGRATYKTSQGYVSGTSGLEHTRRRIVVCLWQTHSDIANAALLTTSSVLDVGHQFTVEPSIIFRGLAACLVASWSGIGHVRKAVSSVSCSGHLSNQTYISSRSWEYAPLRRITWCVDVVF